MSRQAGGTNSGGGQARAVCKAFRATGSCQTPGCKFAHISEGPAEGASTLSTILNRPVLHLVVLYASDPRVTAYARGVAQKFVDAGLDVFVNVRRGVWDGGGWTGGVGKGGGGEGGRRVVVVKVMMGVMMMMMKMMHTLARR